MKEKEVYIVLSVSQKGFAIKENICYAATEPNMSHNVSYGL